MAVGTEVRRSGQGWLGPGTGAAVFSVVCVVLFYEAVRQRDFVAVHLDWPIILWVNGFASPYPFVNHAINQISELPTLTGAFIMSLLWYCWFAQAGEARRIQLVLGLGASVLAVVISRALQVGLPMHLRPLHDQAIGFVTPAGIDAAALNAWSSFPSDHAAIYFAMATVVWRASPRLGVLAGLSALFSTLPRIYTGFHFPSDIAFGAMLGISVVTLVEAYGPTRLAQRVLAWGEARPAMFYAIAFMLAYQLATLFVDIRQFGWIDPRRVGLGVDMVRRLLGL